MASKRKKSAKSAVLRPPPPLEISKKSLRLWIFRAASLFLIPAAVLMLMEGALRLWGYGEPTAFWLRRSVAGKSVLIPSDYFSHPYLGRHLARRPWPAMLDAPKDPATLRIVVFGESAAYGDPRPEFGLPRMLQTLLGGRYPEKHVEVVNAAMTAINSHSIVRIARDSAALKADVWIVYMGNNEVVGPFGAGTVFGPKAPKKAFVDVFLALRTSRFGQALVAMAERLKPANSQRSWAGMKMFVQNQVPESDPRLQNVYGNFEKNLREILRLAHQCGAKVIVSTMGCNLKDCAPFGSMHRSGLSPAEHTQWETAFRQGTEAEQLGRWGDAVSFFRQAGTIDNTYAAVHYQWGKASLRLGDYSEAGRQFRLARDQDTLRFRADSRINHIINSVASNRENEGAYFCDGEKALASASSEGLPGRELFYEHVHLTPEGNYVLAKALADQVSDLVPGKPATGGRSWPSLQECDAALGWSDLAHYEAATMIYERILEPPFTEQLNYEEERARLQAEVEGLLPALQPAGLNSAEAACRRALAISTNDWVLWRNLAEVQQKLHNLDGALENWRRITARLPYYSLGWESAAGLETELRQDDRAQEDFLTALNLDPQLRDSHNGLARVLVHQQNTAGALQEYQKAIELDPAFGPTHLNYARLLETAGRADQAQLQLQAAFQCAGESPAFCRMLAHFCAEKGWVEGACTNYMRALHFLPWDGQTQLLVGSLLSQLGRHSEAEQHLAEAARLQPQSAEARMRLGVELARQGKEAQAVEPLTEAIRLKPDAPDSHLELAMVLLKQHREKEALAEFQEVLRRQPGNPQATKYVEQLQATLATPQANPSSTPTAAKPGDMPR